MIMPMTNMATLTMPMSMTMPTTIMAIITVMTTP